jgi:hypothetical protein
MLYGEEIAVFSLINTKDINTVWQKVKFLNVKPAVATRSQQALTGEIFPCK